MTTTVDAPEAKPATAISVKPAKTPELLGPFVCRVTHETATVWLQITNLGEGEVIRLEVTLHEAGDVEKLAELDAIRVGELPAVASAPLVPSYEEMKVGTATFDSLKPDTFYFYRLWLAAGPGGGRTPLPVPGLVENDLFFMTLPAEGYKHQLDFLLMSCHNPDTSKGDGYDGFGIWARIPEIRMQNKNVRFAILAGDQAYGDEVETKVLNEPDERRRRELYLGVYKKFWDNVHYRRALCSLPAILMWDDHDITDGWGSREDSFKGPEPEREFTAEWKRLFATARSVFAQMQARRNPPPLSEGYAQGFDTCFKIGGAGFAVADLRSNRNVREQRVWRPEQMESIRRWVEANRDGLHTFFFVSPVVFSHGAPSVERSILKYWFYVLDFMKWFGRLTRLKKLAQWFDHTVGDLRDDINDSWGSDVNREEAERVLDFLFSLQNPPAGVAAMNVVILSGDIHTPGYSTIYSADPAHDRRAAIPHVVATPVAYQPFSWVGEAVFRHLTRVVNLGTGKKYTAQVSHHFCYRNVVVVSLRNYERDESHLKVKYYLEGFPEPQVMLFDLNHGSRRENINWDKRTAKSPLP